MADFKHKRFGQGGRPSFNRGPRRDFGDREMFDAECASCGKTTQVPFRPNGKKPVFCRDCFAAQGGGEEAPRGPRPQMRGFGGPRHDGPRPPHHEKRDPRIDDMQRTLASMNATLERIAGILEKSERAAALSAEVEKYREPVAKKAKAPKKVAAKKKAAK